MVSDSIWEGSMRENSEKKKEKEPEDPDQDLTNQFFVSLQSAYRKIQQRTSYTLTEASLVKLKDAEVPEAILAGLGELKDQTFASQQEFLKALENLGIENMAQYRNRIVENAEKQSPLDAYPEVTAEIESLLNSDKHWKNAYHIEQLMIPLFNDEELEVEIERRLVDAQRNLTPDISAFYHEKFASRQAESADSQDHTLGRSKKEALVGRLVEDLQWNYALRQRRRYYSSEARMKTSRTFILLLTFFLVLDLLSELLHLEAALGEFYADTYYLMVAIGMGAIGAAFSMLISLRNLADSTLDDLRVFQRWPYIGSRVSIGIGAALVVFYFLQTEILGSSFPKIEITTQIDRATAALTTILCFLSGFSEQFVPNLLSKTEEKIEGQTQTNT
jgi:hypothetical protein